MMHFFDVFRKLFFVLVFEMVAAAEVDYLIEIDLSLEDEIVFDDGGMVRVGGDDYFVVLLFVGEEGLEECGVGCVGELYFFFLI